jgi:hypothetical protein
MQHGRYMHASALLPDGRVLIMGGEKAYGGDYEHSTTNTTDIFDPVTESFTPGPAMNFARSPQAVYPFAEGILVVGGGEGWGVELPNEFFRYATNTFEVFPHAEAFSNGGTHHLLPDNEHILVIGALKPEAGLTPLSLSDVLPPFIYSWRTGAVTWIAEPAPGAYHRRAAKLINLRDGKTLVVGGYKDYITTQTSPNSWSTVEVAASTGFVFDPVNLTFTDTNPFNVPRIAHNVLMLADGRIGIYGGLTTPGYDYVSKSVEIYDPTTGVFTAAAKNSVVLSAFESIILPSGLTMHVAGQTQNSSTNTTVMIHDAVLDRSGMTGSMVQASILRNMIRLNNGLVLVTGGENLTGAILDTAEMFDPEGPIQMSFPSDWVHPSGVIQFTVKTSLDVEWSTTAGSITATGMFTAPSTPGECWIRVSSKTDPTVFSQAKIRVIEGIPE